MSSLRLEGVRFTAYPNDHQPRHVHGFYAEMEAIVDLKPDGTIALADISDALRPSNARIADVRHILSVAAKHFTPRRPLGEAP